MINKKKSCLSAKHSDRIFSLAFFGGFAEKSSKQSRDDCYCNTSGTGSQSSRKGTKQPITADRFPDPFCKSCTESGQGYRGTCSGKIDQRLIQSDSA